MIGFVVGAVVMIGSLLLVLPQQQQPSESSNSANSCY